LGSWKIHGLIVISIGFNYIIRAYLFDKGDNNIQRIGKFLLRESFPIFYIQGTIFSFISFLEIMLFSLLLKGGKYYNAFSRYLFHNLPDTGFFILRGIFVKGLKMKRVVMGL